MIGTHHPLSSSHIQDDDVTGQAVAEWLENFGKDDHLREENHVLLSSFFTIFIVLLDLSVDPYQEVATSAQMIVDYITALLLESPFGRLDALSNPGPHPPQQPPTSHNDSLVVFLPSPCPSLFTTATNES